METSLGFGHFLTHTDGIARFILALMLIMSVGTWYLIATKGAQAIRSQKKSAEFLAAFWAAPSLDAVARHLRQTAPDLPRGYLSERLDAGWLEAARRLDCTTIHPGFRALTDAQVRLAKQHGYPVLVWTVNEPPAADFQMYCSSSLFLVMTSTVSATRYAE